MIHSHRTIRIVLKCGLRIGLAGSYSDSDYIFFFFFLF